MINRTSIGRILKTTTLLTAMVSMLILSAVIISSKINNLSENGIKTTGTITATIQYSESLNYYCYVDYIDENGIPRNARTISLLKEPLSVGTEVSIVYAPPKYNEVGVIIEEGGYQ